MPTGIEPASGKIGRIGPPGMFAKRRRRVEVAARAALLSAGLALVLASCSASESKSSGASGSQGSSASAGHSSGPGANGGEGGGASNGNGVSNGGSGAKGNGASGGGGESSGNGAGATEGGSSESKGGKSAGASGSGKGSAGKPRAYLDKEPNYAKVPSSAATESGLVKIAYRNYAIAPDTVKVKVGSTIRWTNYDSSPADVKSEGGPIKFASAQFGQGKSFEVKATKPGVIHYECTLEPTTMNGTIEVVE